MSASEDEASDRGHVGEDADAEYDDDGCLQLRTDAELVAEEHEQCCRHHVGEEGDHKHAVGEAALEIGSRAAKLEQMLTVVSTELMPELDILKKGEA